MSAINKMKNFFKVLFVEIIFGVMKYIYNKIRLFAIKIRKIVLPDFLFETIIKISRRFSILYFIETSDSSSFIYYKTFVPFVLV